MPRHIASRVNIVATTAARYSARKEHEPQQLPAEAHVRCAACKRVAPLQTCIAIAGRHVCMACRKRVATALTRPAR